jgi:hypothetical protein
MLPSSKAVSDTPISPDEITRVTLLHIQAIIDMIESVANDRLHNLKLRPNHDSKRGINRGVTAAVVEVLRNTKDQVPGIYSIYLVDGDGFGPPWAAW